MFLLLAATLALSPLALHARRHAQPRASVSEGLDAESDSVGPGIYGGRVVIGDDGEVVIGQQFEEHNPLPGPVYAGGGYTALSSAIRTSPEEVGRVLAEAPELAFEVTTGGATPLGEGDNIPLPEIPTPTNEDGDIPLPTDPNN